MRIPFTAIPIPTPILGVLLAVAALPSCSKSSDEPDQGRVVSTRAKHPLEARFAYSEEDIQREKGGAISGGKRSQYDKHAAVAFGGDIGKESYRTAKYKSGSWNGNKAARTKNYAGNTDGSHYQTASAYRDPARQSGQRSRYHRKAAGTSNFLSGRASESGLSHRKPVDSYTSHRRNNTPPPTIWSKEEYEQLSVDRTRSLLGRDD